MQFIDRRTELGALTLQGVQLPPRCFALVGKSWVPLLKGT